MLEVDKTELSIISSPLGMLERNKNVYFGSKHRPAISTR